MNYRKILEFVKVWLNSNIDDALSSESLRSDSMDLKEKIIELENEIDVQ